MFHRGRIRPLCANMAREIPKGYEPQLIEQRWAQHWVDSGLFRAEESAAGPVFCIVIPPPNVTGYIHIGHMLEHTQIDVLTRWHRMRGEHTLWLPGMDHAGISKTRVGMESQKRRHHQEADDPARRFRRLVTREIHFGSSALSRCAGSI